MLSSVQFSRNTCSTFKVRLQTFDGLSKVVCLTSTVETNQQLPNLPGRFQPSTFGVCGLNYCVRYGNRWNPTAIVTGYFVFRNIYVTIVTCLFQQVSFGNLHSLKTKQCKNIICQDVFDLGGSSVNDVPRYHSELSDSLRFLLRLLARNNLVRCLSLLIPRKEVIQPHLPIRLPCYDFTPIIGPTLDG